MSTSMVQRNRSPFYIRRCSMPTLQHDDDNVISNPEGYKIQITNNLITISVLNNTGLFAIVDPRGFHAAQIPSFCPSVV